jgi:Gpi18-like mannosyltransferase
LTARFLPFVPTFPYAKEWLAELGPRWLTTWAHFDGVHYLTIIRQGYEGTGLIQAFFPLYPLLVRLLSFDGLINPIIVGTLFSTVALIGALYLLHQLVLFDTKDKSRANRTIGYQICFVTAFFFASVYTESLFLLLSVASFYMARKGKWAGAGVVGMLAALTRLSGGFIAAGLVWEYWLQHKQFDRRGLWAIVPLLGIGLYMLYLLQTFGDPLLFVSVQSEFGAGREPGRFILLYQVIYRYLRMLLTVPVASVTYYQVSQELLVGLFGLVGSVLAFKKVRASYAIYALLSFLLPTLTGTFSSMPRYVLVLFPLFMTLSLIRSRVVAGVIMALFLVLQVINLILLTMGIWVA